MERQITKYYGTYKIPTYAICALEYGEYDDLNDEDIKNIEEFEKRLQVACPEGYLLDWGGDENEEYFTSCPEFGLACDVRDLRVYRIINTELEDADINNKDVTDDFEWMMDDWEGVESESSTQINVHRILFWKRDCACRLTYRYADNWFDVEVINDEDGDSVGAAKELTKLLHNATDDTDDLYLDVDIIEDGEHGKLFKAHCEFKWIMKLVNDGNYGKKETENARHC